MTQPTTTVPERSVISQEHRWNEESVFPTREAWGEEIKAIQAALPAFSAYQGGLNEGPATLAEALEARDEMARRVMVALMFAIMCHEVDKNDQEAAAMRGKASGLVGQALGTVAFIEPEVLDIGQATIEAWMAEEPRLEIYAHYFDDLFRKQAHVRSAEVEELLGLLADPFRSIEATAGMLTEADMKFPPAVDSQGNLIEVNQGSKDLILSGADREARRTAWESYADTYLAFKNTLANNLVTSIKQNIFTMRARRHESSLEAALYKYNIPVAVFHNLIDTFRANLPTWQRYFAIRRQALGVEKLQPYDIWAPLTEDRPGISFERAVDWISQGLAPLGEEYVTILRKGCLEERWVDIYPNQGKTAGAFSFGGPGTHPFIVMSYTDEVFSLSTLAHELGHSMHSYLAWQTQPTVYSDYSMFVAETASNFHQAMVRASLLEKEPDRDLQIGLIEEAMANFYRYFLVMPTLARFELETHQRVERGESLNAEIMIELMADLFQEAYGDQVQVDRQRVGITWATFSHLYVDYYVFQYATGISAAHALSQRVLSGKPGVVDDYLTFLKAGSSLYPLEALEVAGVDMTSPQAVKETFQVMAGLVDRLEKLLA